MNNLTYRKSRFHAPKQFFACEAHGLQWLAKAQQEGGPRVAKVFGYGDSWLDLERIYTSFPTEQAALQFGKDLARMHDAGAHYFGEPPEGYDGPCYFGPLDDPVPMDTGQWEDVCTYFGEGRLLPMVKLGIKRGILDNADLDLTCEVIDHFDILLGQAKKDTPARIHGDLWSGNVLWTSAENTDTTQSSNTNSTHAVLIDPAAHGGHREEDLAMLHLFGMSYLSAIMEGYRSVHPLASGFNERITLWQLYPIAGHCVFFAGGYVSQYRRMCHTLLRQRQ